MGEEGPAREFHTDISHHRNRLLESLAANALVYFGHGTVDSPLRLPHCESAKGERHRGALPPHCKFAQQQPERGLSLMGIGRSLVRCRGEWEGHNNKHMARERESVPQNISGCNRHSIDYWD